MRIYAFDFARLVLAGLLLLATSPMRRSATPVPHSRHECIAIGGLPMGCRPPMYAPHERGRLNGLERPRYLLRDSD